MVAFGVGVTDIPAIYECTKNANGQTPTECDVFVIIA